MPKPGTTLILHDAGPAALLACACLREEIALSKAPSTDLSAIAFPATAHHRLESLRRLCDLFSTPLRDYTPPPVITDAGASEREVVELLHAAHYAARLGIERVIWPATGAAGETLDLDRVAQIIDRAVLVGRLVGLDSREHGTPSIRIETPYADFTDHQVADLVMDMNLPFENCWFWDRKDDAEKKRWEFALQAVGWTG